MFDVQKATHPVPDEKLAFWFSNGKIVRSLDELASVLETLPADIFKYHVNRDKNDLHAWVVDVFSDDLLAEVIKDELDQKKMAEKIKRHIAFLKKPVLTPQAQQSPQAPVKPAKAKPHKGKK